MILGNFFERIACFCEQKSELAICSEKTSDLLIYHDQPERIA